MHRQPISRRTLMHRATAGFSSLALTAMMAEQAQAEGIETVKAIHHPPKARSVIYLYMEGGPSQIDTFDYKPQLEKDHGKKLPVRAPKTVFNIGNKVMKSPFRFARHGESGAWVSEILPHLANQVDHLTFIKSMHHGVSNHSSACYMSHTGYPTVGKPSMGSWITYGLGSESQNLPGFVVLDCGQGPSGGAPSWGSGFLPASYQGTLFTKNQTPVEYILPQEETDRQQEKIAAIRALNEQTRDSFFEDSRIDARMASFEKAFRMQSAVPDLLDFSDETKATRSLYGIDDPKTELFGTRCLLARKLVEQGVRFVELFPPRVKADRWDQHGNLEDGHRRNARVTDKPIAGLLVDLKNRGMLEDTIVLWGGEFGRTPNQQGSNGRDHNPFGYTVWLCGGGFKPGFQFGKTDDYGYHAIEDRVHLHDLHATILHQLGIDHRLLTYRHSGRDFRLTDVAGKVVRPILG